MKVRMVVSLTGTRDGVAWPPRGEVVEVGNREGADLCAAGLAEPVAEKRAEAAEKRPAGRKAEKRG